MVLFLLMIEEVKYLQPVQNRRLYAEPSVIIRQFGQRLVRNTDLSGRIQPEHQNTNVLLFRPAGQAR